MQLPEHMYPLFSQVPYRSEDLCLGQTDTIQKIQDRVGCPTALSMMVDLCVERTEFCSKWLAQVNEFGLQDNCSESHLGVKIGNSIR